MIGRFKEFVNNVKRMIKSGSYAERLGMCFVVIMAFFFIANIAMPDAEFSDVENRTLQKFPKISVSEYTSGRLEKKLENYVNDQFIGRNAFIRLKSAVDVSAGSVYSNGVWMGKDGYLMEDVTVPSKKNMKKIVKSVAAFKKANKNLDMSFLLAPTAANIYSDKLPALAQTADQNAYMDKFFKDIKKAGVKPIDVRPELLAGKKDALMFYRTDHHWTSDGAQAAFAKYAEEAELASKDFELSEVKNDFVGSLAAKCGFVGGKADIIKLPTAVKGSNSVIYYYDTQKKTTKFYKMKNLDKRDAYTVFGGQNHPVYTIKTPVKSSRRLLLVKDSYANSMLPFLMQSYREIVVVDPRYYYEDLDMLMLTEDVSEVLFLYNANTLFEDDSLTMMLSDY